MIGSLQTPASVFRHITVDPSISIDKAQAILSERPVIEGSPSLGVQAHSHSSPPLKCNGRLFLLLSG